MAGGVWWAALSFLGKFLPGHKALLQQSLSPPQGPTPGSGEPPEGRTQGGAQKLRSDPPTVRNTAKKRTQGKRMSAQILKTDAVDGVKKDRKAHRGTTSSRNFDQNVCPVGRVHMTQTSALIWKKFPIWENFKSPPPKKKRTDARV